MKYIIGLLILSIWFIVYHYENKSVSCSQTIGEVDFKNYKEKDLNYTGEIETVWKILLFKYAVNSNGEKLKCSAKGDFN